MATRRPRRDDDYDDDDDDRPRSRRRRDDDDEDERPRRRRRDEDDEDERPMRRPRRRSRGPGTGLILGILGGVVGLVVVVVLIIVFARGGLGGADISYAKFRGINSSTTIESLEKDFGKAKKLERAEWSTVYYAKTGDDFGGGFGGNPNATLADLGVFGNPIDAWYHWHSGSEDIYVATGVDRTGRSRLVYKVYTNSNAMRENARAGGDMSKIVPNFEAVPVR